MQAVAGQLVRCHVISKSSGVNTVHQEAANKGVEMLSRSSNVRALVQKSGQLRADSRERF